MALVCPVTDNLPRILVVEDSKSNRDMIKNILSENYEVLLAKDGKQGVIMAKHELPDLIIMDAIMPVMNGYDACSLLKADPLTASIPIIFITARNSSEDELHGLSVGAIDYIAKPFSPAIIELRVRNHLDLKFYRDQLEELAGVDDLTRLANRRRFNETMNQEWARCKRGQHPLSLCLIDIDHFKAYNDHYGHLKGDDTLHMVANALKHTVSRPGDMVARFGGEEFVAILPNTNHENALLIAKKFQQSIYQLFIPHEKSPSAITLSASIGVATCLPDNSLSPVELVDCSDQFLYQAKQNGRNQVFGGELG